MRLVLPFLLLSTVACAMGREVIPVRPVADGANRTTRTEQQAVLVARTSQELEAHWSSQIGRGVPPAIDFSTEVAVFLLAGSRPTGGHAVKVRGVKIEDGVLVVDAAVEPPAADSIVSQAFTWPYAVIAVPKGDFTDVRWAP